MVGVSVVTFERKLVLALAVETSLAVSSAPVSKLQCAAGHEPDIHIGTYGYLQSVDACVVSQSATSRLHLQL